MKNRENYFDFFFDIKISISAVVDFFFSFLNVKLVVSKDLFNFRTICVEKTYKGSEWIGINYII